MEKLNGATVQFPGARIGYAVPEHFQARKESEMDSLRRFSEISRDDLTARMPRRRRDPTERPANGRSRVRDGLRSARHGAARLAEAANRPERRRRSRRRRRLGIAAGAGAAGGAGAYFLDPNNGKRRRHLVRDRVASLLRRGESKPEGPTAGGEEPAPAPSADGVRGVESHLPA